MTSRRGFRALAAVATFAIGAIGACGSFDASSDPAPTVPTDGGSTSVDAAPTATAPTTTTTTSPPPAPDAGPRFCADAGHMLCDDFDLGAIGGSAQWTASKNLTSCTLSNDHPVSAPNALAVTGSPPVYLQQQVARNGTTLHCDLELELLGAVAAGARTDLLDLQMTTGDGTGEALETTLYVSDQGVGITGRLARAAISMSLFDYVLGAAPPLSEWHHVRATLTASPGSSSFNVAGVGSQAEGFDGLTGPVASVGVTVGVLQGSGGPFHVAFDNVVCDLDP